MHTFDDMAPPFDMAPSFVNQRLTQLKIPSMLNRAVNKMPSLDISQIKTSLEVSERESYMQSTIKKDDAVKEWLLKNKKLDIFSNEVIKNIKTIFQHTSSVQSYSIELNKEELPGLPADLTMYVTLSQKVDQEEMMDLWKRISARSIKIMRKISNNQKEFENMLETTTITLRQY